MLVAPSYKGSYNALTIRERDCGQFAQARKAKALQERPSCGKAQPTVGAGEFLYKLEIAKRHDESTLVGVEEPVDFRLADRLLECNAGKHFERGGRELRTPACWGLFAQIPESVKKSGVKPDQPRL